MNEQPAVLYCANHPTVETTLRCNSCEKPICPKCAVLTPTGYRCKECVRGQQKAFETAVWHNYPVAFIISALLSFLGSWLPSFLGFLTIFIAPIAGIIIAETVRFVVKRRRSKRLFQVTALAAALGSAPLLILAIINFMPGGFQLAGLLHLLWQGLYAFILTSTVYYRLGGIQI